MNAEPSDHLVPNTDNESTLEEKLGDRFLDFIAKGALTVVWPSMTLQVIRYPHMVLDDKPSEYLAFRGSPVPPDCDGSWAANLSLELGHVRRSRRVVFTTRAELS